MSILLKNVTLEKGREVNIYIEDNLILEISKEVKDADKILDCNNKIVIPGLANMHTHAAMILLRGYADDMLLQEWLEKKIWPIEAKFNEEIVYYGTKLACLEMIKTGTTLFSDMYLYMKAALKAVKEMGLRAMLAEAYFDFFDEEVAEQYKKKSLEFLNEVKREGCERIIAALGPHAIYTVSKDSLEWISELANEKDVRIHFHLSETEKENKDCIKKYGKSPTKYLAEINFLSNRVFAAHAVYLSERDVRLLSNHNVKVVSCPTSNMKLCVGSALNYPLLKKHKVLVTLGTDSASSNNNLDMFEEMKFFSLLQKFYHANPVLLPAKETFEIASTNAYKALGLNGGKIEEGALADIVVLNAKNHYLLPTHNLISNLVYSANGSVVETVICDGKILMECGKVKDEDKIKQDGINAIKKLIQENG
ncbi:MAG TPA: amidohydrolase [Candidatus Altiarchaeales archaeon]|nr:amidohydrolase [Candidatus Altiarchaeales archaeon]